MTTENMVYTLCRTLLSHKNRMKLVLCNWKPLYIKNPVSNRQVTVFKNVIYPNMTDILESDHCFLPFFILRIIRLFFFFLLALCCYLYPKECYSSVSGSAMKPSHLKTGGGGGGRKSGRTMSG